MLSSFAKRVGFLLLNFKGISNTLPLNKFSFGFVNKVTIIGNVGADCEVKEIGDKKLISFRVATSESYKNKAGEIEKNTQWHRVKFFTQKEYNAPQNYLKKGTRVHVEGRLDYKQFEVEGVTKNVTDIIVSDRDGVVTILSPGATQTPVEEEK